MGIEFKLSDYWQGESEWSNEKLPKLFEDICKSPLSRRILITGPIGVGKSRLARIMAAYIRFYRTTEDKRRILLQRYKDGAVKDPHSGIPESSIDHFSSINVATLPVDSGLGDLFGIAPGWFSEVHASAGLFEKVMYKSKENTFYIEHYEAHKEYYEKNKENRDIDSFPDPDGFDDGVKDVITGGIVFLDEIADAHPSHQTALLKVVAEGFFHRLGCKIKNEHFRGIIIGATWKDLTSNTVEEIHQDDIKGKLNKKIIMKPSISPSNYNFRPDLLSRFAGAVIEIPPLAQRPEDIIPHSKQICKEINSDILRTKSEQLEDDRSLRKTDFIENIEGYLISGDGISRHGRLKFADLVYAIKKYDWNRGNARELRTAIERYVTAKGGKEMEQIIKEMEKF